MKIALIQDQLLTQAGSERVTLYMAQEFPEADLFTLCYNAETTWQEFRAMRIRTHWLGRFIPNHGVFKACFPLSTYLMQWWDFREYDLILTSSATTAKYIANHRARHLCYCYFPTRAIWSREQYFGDRPGLKARLFTALAPYFKRRDVAAAQRVDRFVAISESSRAAIKRIYGRDATVLFPPIDLDRFRSAVTSEKGDYFLIVGRLQAWKQTEYAIEAFNALGLPLRIIGTGPEEARLRAMAGPNISFLGAVDDDELATAYGQARAVIFTPELEYGLVPIEAIASGTPVIALGRGGVLETMTERTAIFFPEPTAESLTAAVRRFENADFPQEVLLEQAQAFGIPHFKQRLRAIVDEFAATR